jgi:two-component system phosphate regulon sensor histidine kinase PhoR
MKMQTERMQALVEDLLFLSKIEDRPRAAQDAVVEVEQLISNIVEMTQAKISAKQQQLDLDIDPGINIRGKASDLHSAFTNLLVNAVNYTQTEGRISLHWQAHADGARFSVRDNGPGIPRHHLSRITERFYRIDTDRSREGGGTGLGLAIVKHVVQRHDGVLEIDSEEGKGSQFSCIFPATRIQQRLAERAKHD